MKKLILGAAFITGLSSCTNTDTAPTKTNHDNNIEVKDLYMTGELPTNKDIELRTIDFDYNPEDNIPYQEYIKHGDRTSSILETPRNKFPDTQQKIDTVIKK